MPRPKKPEAAVPVEPIAPVEPAINLIVTNCVKGSQLHLGDGRVLEHGESAEVSHDLAVFLRERKQAE